MAPLKTSFGSTSLLSIFLVLGPCFRTLLAQRLPVEVGLKYSSLSMKQAALMLPWPLALLSEYLTGFHIRENPRRWFYKLKDFSNFQSWIYITNLRQNFTANYVMQSNFGMQSNLTSWIQRVEERCLKSPGNLSGLLVQLSEGKKFLFCFLFSSSSFFFLLLLILVFWIQVPPCLPVTLKKYF